MRKKSFVFYLPKGNKKGSFVSELKTRTDLLKKSPKICGRLKRRNDFSTNFTIPRPGSFGKLLQNDVQVD